MKAGRIAVEDLVMYVIGQRHQRAVIPAAALNRPPEVLEEDFLHGLAVERADHRVVHDELAVVPHEVVSQRVCVENERKGEDDQSRPHRRRQNLREPGPVRPGGSAVSRTPDGRFPLFISVF